MRRYGLLLHISSLPSAWGIGDLGPAAHAFARLLSGIGARVWQFLPLNPTSTYIGNSPYSSPSAFAGNPLFISPELLVQNDDISFSDLEASFEGLTAGSLGSDLTHVDFLAVTAHRQSLLCTAYERNRERLARREDYQQFCRENAYWLDDYARFVSIKQAYGGAPWPRWPTGLAVREHDAMRAWDASNRESLEREKYIQFLFFSQWRSLRHTCAECGLTLLSDIPIYVTHDSADVWSHPGYFRLGADLQPVTVSGVPPDYFSPLGQRWGTPVYNWEALERDDFVWWKQRLGHALGMADMARLDHFRGFCGYWEIPAAEETAVRGQWRCAPAEKLFSSMRRQLNTLPFLAEDLGVITPDVRELMRRFELPGMHVLQFAFGGEGFAANPDIPHRHTAASVVYTGTHDNTTSLDWFIQAPERERGNFTAYAGHEVAPEEAARALTRLAFASVAETAVLPVQDALNLGGEARMNTPGIAQGNWSWRLLPDQARPDTLAWLRDMAAVYGRL
jgi:4-alpha-glucanotransferase